MKHLKKYVAGLTSALSGIANWRFGVATLLVLPSVVLVAEPAVALGSCTINWIGADGVWESGANWAETTTLANRVPNATDTVCIDDASATSVLTITVSSSVSVLGIDNAEHLVLDSAMLTIEEGGEVVNRGTTTLANGYIQGYARGAGFGARAVCEPWVVGEVGWELHVHPFHGAGRQHRDDVGHRRAARCWAGGGVAGDHVSGVTGGGVVAECERVE